MLYSSRQMCVLLARKEISLLLAVMHQPNVTQYGKRQTENGKSVSVRLHDVETNPDGMFPVHQEVHVAVCNYIILAGSPRRTRLPLASSPLSGKIMNFSLIDSVVSEEGDES